MKQLKRFIIVALIISILFISSGYSENKKPVILYFFWAEGCPYCAKEKYFLSNLKKKYPSLEIKDYEVSYNPAARQLLQTMSKAYNINPSGVPVTFVGNKALVGFSEKTASQIEENIRYCLKTTCGDPLYKNFIDSTSSN